MGRGRFPRGRFPVQHHVAERVTQWTESGCAADVRAIYNVKRTGLLSSPSTTLHCIHSFKMKLIGEKLPYHLGL